jgi:hypothetical protein
MRQSIDKNAKIKLVLTFVFCLFSIFIYAQNLTIQSVDSLQWPKLKVNLSYKGKAKFTKELIKISKNDQLVEFILREASSDNQKVANRSIYIILEASGNTFGKSIADIRSGVRAFIEQLDDNDMMNVGYFSSIEVDSMGLQNISEKFNNRREGLKYDLDSKVKQVKDTLFRVDLFKSVKDGLEYFENEKNIPEQKVFIVISTGKNNSSSPVGASEVNAIAKSAKIPIYTILYQGIDSLVAQSSLKRLSSSSDGKFNRATTDKEITQFIIDYIKEPPPDKVYEGVYDIIIDLSGIVEENSVKLDLHYEGTRQIITASNPDGLSFFTKDYQLYLLISVGILIFILLIMVLAKVFSRKSPSFDVAENEEKKVEKETMSTKEKMSSSTIEEKKAEPKITESKSITLANQNSKITLLVSHEGRTLSFNLNKNINYIGRHENNDIQIQEQTITGKHARFEVNGSEVVLTDLGSTNGTFVNGEKIKTKQLKNTDQIRMGNVEMTIKIS